MPLELNPQQKKAAEAPDGPLLIVAGAGTGKTRTLTSRIVHLIRKGIRPEQICALTFTNKAARQMGERVEQQLPGLGAALKRPFIGTFHSLGARILRAEAKRVGRTGSFVIFDDHDSLQLVKKILKNYPVKEEGPSFFLRRIGLLKNGALTLADLDSSPNPNDKFLPAIFEKYEAALAENNAFDFDDLLVQVVDIFRRYPAVLDKYRRRYPYLLVDEYQDVNNVQYELIRQLAAAHGRLSVVGDDQQTIYSWRGSNFEIFLGFERDWPGATVVLLEENYRSTSNIIAAAGAVIAHNKKQKPKQLWTRQPAGEPVRLVETEDEEQEARWIAGRIRASAEQPASPAAPSDADGEGRAKTTAILYRTNAQSRAIEQALIELGIPYLVFGGLKFYERREIKDIVAALRFASNPNDSVSLQRLQKNFLKKTFLRLKNELPHQVGKLSASQLISYVLEISGYFNELKKDYANFTERIENLNELIYFASNFSSLSEFLERVSLMQSTDNIKNNKDSRKSNINLMTVHLAKGLEFDNVFIAGCNEGVLPHQMSYFSEEEIEEERRLMYVAMTRARQKLYLNFYHLPSRFLSEIPAEFLEFSVSKSIDDEERYIEY